MLDELIDKVGEDDIHPLASLMEILGVLIEHYEEACVRDSCKAIAMRPDIAPHTPST